jgi:RNA polymerase sigma factor (TIGR02999 family)
VPGSLIAHELRTLARRYMRAERHGHTLQATALVNEAWIRLVNAPDLDWRNRAHFFAISTQTMRRILVDAARARRSAKRGAGAAGINLDVLPELGSTEDKGLVALDDALTTLVQIDPRKARVVELRFFLA